LSLATDPPGGRQQGIAAGRRDQRPGTVIASRACVRIELMASCAPRAVQDVIWRTPRRCWSLTVSPHGCKVTNACLAAWPERQVLTRKVAEMRRVALTLIGALLVLTAGTASASAAPPIDVDANPEKGGVTVTVSVGETEIPIESITAGLKGGEEDKNASSCASGVIHTSCTPADEASN
jgi:hypothetical protein